MKKILLMCVMPFSLVTLPYYSPDMMEKGVTPEIMIQNAKIAQKAVEIIYLRRGFKLLDEPEISNQNKLGCLKTACLLTAGGVGCVMWCSSLIWLGFFLK